MHNTQLIIDIHRSRAVHETAKQCIYKHHEYLGQAGEGKAQLNEIHFYRAGAVC